MYKIYLLVILCALIQRSCIILDGQVKVVLVYGTCISVGIQ